MLSITLLACEMSATVRLLGHSLALPFFGIGMKFRESANMNSFHLIYLKISIFSETNTALESSLDSVQEYIA